MRILRGKLTFFLALAAIYLLAWILQSTILLNWDVSWLMYASQRLLAGGNYAHDFFELNPPLILYLYMPPVWLAKQTGMSLPTALRLSVFCLSAISLVFCYPALRTWLPAADKSLRSLLLLLLAIVFLLLPMHEFGQREHLLILFAMPYFLLMSQRVANQPVTTVRAAMIGLFSGFGFALKPHFLIAPLLIECYYGWQQRRWLALLRPETIVLASLLILYTGAVLWLHPDYLHTVVPLNLRIAFYSAYAPGWKAQITNAYFIFSALVLLLAVTQYDRHARYNALLITFVLAITGLLIAYLVQRTAWYYHASPAYQLATLLAAMLLVLLTTHANTAHDLRRALLAACVALLMFYLFWGGVNTERTDLIPLLAVITSGFFILLLALTHQQSRLQAIGRSAMGALLMICILSFPLVNAYQSYTYAVTKQANLAAVTTFLRLHAWHKPVYYLANSATDTLPIITAAEALPATRMEDAGWIPAFLQREQQQQPSSLADKNFLINIIAADINEYKPDYILVDRGNDSTHVLTMQFDYVTYLSSNPAFREALKNYHFFTTLQKPTIYRFDVYQRTNTQSVLQNT